MICVIFVHETLTQHWRCDLLDREHVWRANNLIVSSLNYETSELQFLSFEDRNDEDEVDDDEEK